MTTRLGVFAYGLGLGLAPLTNAATSSVSLKDVGVASSVLALARNLSGAFGIAIFATILSNSTTSNLIAIEQHSVINTNNQLILSSIPYLMITKANVMSYGIVFKVAALFIALGMISALFVKDNKRGSSPVGMITE